ncbi:ArpU family phage packaging/lysis transcriptional regulator [Lysinibacillus sp. KU-BSD001]|uniref:ArpU family phage packaging/lysis transcriptional regulator n=1 Tax=Lysinibacillus sp. KU-BSD001 TaxID=3141328 RepID=UPI0036E9579C
MRTIQRVDEKLTKVSLEEKLEKYRVYLVTLPADHLPSITPAYALAPGGSNQFNSKTENAAIERVQFELERERYFDWIHRAVASLKHDERQIIVRRYLQMETDYDIDIWTDLNIGKTTYYKKKWQAMLRLAFALKIEVYHKMKNEVSL